MRTRSFRDHARGFTRRLALVALFVGSGATGCDRHVEPFVPGEEARAPDLSRIFPPEATGPPAGATAALPDAAGRRGSPPLAGGSGSPPSNSSDALRGVIELAAGATAPPGAVLFIIARRAGAGGPPLAVVREPAPRFPFAFAIGPEHVMMPGTNFEGALVVSARLDRDGSATTREPSDLEGAIAAAVAVGASGLSIVLGGDEPAAGAPTASASAGDTVRGTIRIASPLADATPAGGGTLFLIARSASARGGPPIAVLRIPQPSFPLDYEIGPAQVMIPTLRFEGELTLSARLDTDGDAITRSPGDLQNTNRIVATPGTSEVEIVLDERL